MSFSVKKERDEINERRKFVGDIPKARAGLVKSKLAIKPGRQDGKLIIFRRACANGECSECGIEKYFTSTKYPLEKDAELINIRECRDIARNNSENKQKLVAVTVTADELILQRLLQEVS